MHSGVRWESLCGSFRKILVGKPGPESQIRAVGGEQPRARNSARTSGTRRAYGFNCSDPGRNRNRQGTDRARNSQYQLALRTFVCKAELRRGDIPQSLQPKLLRVLQEQEFERLGSARTHQVDVRLVAATNRDLTEMVKRKEFRSDLYYRLNVFPVLLPPLRARRGDIPALVTHFVETFGRRMDKKIEHIPPETMTALSSYPWPGNIRELQNLIERAVILSNEGVLSNPLSTQLIPENNQVAVSTAPTTLRDSERTLILHTLEEAGWLVGGANGAAAKLGLKRTTLINKMKKLGISRPSPQRGQNAMGLAPHETDPVTQVH